MDDTAERRIHTSQAENELAYRELDMLMVKI